MCVEETINPPKGYSIYLQRWKRLKTTQHFFSARWESEHVPELYRELSVYWADTLKSS